MRALITGITGQDGSYLAELLLSQGYSVTGVVRRQSVPEHQSTRLEPFLDRITTIYGDVTDFGSILHAVNEVQPHEIYNLAAQSHVGISTHVASYTAQTNALGAINVFEAACYSGAPVRVYQASSSEMFGNSADADGCQREDTPMRPVSPYGAAKQYAFNMARWYRAGRHLHICNGILFNHESPRRGANFVTAKVIKTSLEILAGRHPGPLALGNIDAQRDWGHSADYVRAMWLMLQRPTADDYVIATGETRSVRDLVHYVFDKLGLSVKRDLTANSPQFMRPVELNALKGDAAKARSVLGWEPTYTFEAMIDECIRAHAAAMGVELGW